MDKSRHVYELDRNRGGMMLFADLRSPSHRGKYQQGPQALAASFQSQ